MTSLEQYVTKVKPALETYLRSPNKTSLESLYSELKKFNWGNLKIFNIQVLIPLVLKLEELSGQNQELQMGTIKCISLVSSQLYLDDIKGLRTTIIIVLKQIRVFNNATTIPNLSEEIKLAAVKCIATQLERSTSDTLEAFYTKESSSLLGQLLLTLVEFIEQEKYKKLILESIRCLLVIFYVHDQADLLDVVLRSQVADTLFIFLPKVVTVLAKTSLCDGKMGETLKATALKALGRILCVMYEETTYDYIKTHYEATEFQELVSNALLQQSNADTATDAEILGINKNKTQLEERMKQMQINGRSKQWIGASSRKLHVIFEQTKILRSHQSAKIRQEYATMSCTLLRQCSHNLKDNYMLLLENVVALAEDSEPKIREQCEEYLHKLQSDVKCLGLFDESAEKLFEIHLTKFPRIILRSQDDEQYAELLFLKGFLRNLSSEKLQCIFALPSNVQLFSMCLLEAAELCVTRELLYEEYALRTVEHSAGAFHECFKLPWCKFKNLSSERCIRTLREICGTLGGTQYVNQVFMEYFLNLLHEEHTSMNELLLIMTWLATERDKDKRKKPTQLVDKLLVELFDDIHWHLALQADQIYRLKPDKPSSWFVDRTPGLYESAIEVRTQDYDSDDEADKDLTKQNYVTLNDAQYNILHTCIVLEAIGHCATFVGEDFSKYTFNCLHKVLLKLAHSNAMVHQAAYFALISIQKALQFEDTTYLIDSHSDYISFHLNTILKRVPESSGAVDILTAVLKFSTRDALGHLDGVFQTIREECTKTYQSENVLSYLKVFNAFLQNIAKWQVDCTEQLPLAEQEMQVDFDAADLYANWLEILEKPKSINENLYCDLKGDEKEKDELNTDDNDAENNANTDNTITEPLPRHIETIKEILNQVLKFVSNSQQAQQILSLECLITGVPLLKDYENELLPLVHSIWQPLVEKFRQRDAIVLNRCFTLLNTLGVHAKEFILKRSLDNVIPFLKQFMKESAHHSAAETSKAHTQEYKLQLILLQQFSSFVKNLQIDGKHLNDIADITTLYLSTRQPKELQNHAVNFYKDLSQYNAPLVYVVILQKAHLSEYKENVDKIMQSFGIK